MQFKIFYKLLPLHRNLLPPLKEAWFHEVEDEQALHLEFPKPLQKQCPGLNADLVWPKTCPGQEEQKYLNE